MLKSGSTFIISFFGFIYLTNGYYEPILPNFNGVEFMERNISKIDNFHTRHKRQLPLMFPEGGTMKLLLGFAMPIDNPIKLNMVFAINFQYQYAVPPNISFFTQYYPFVQITRKKRSMESHDRGIFYSAMEKTMDGIGVDGHSCLLRTICEAAEAPVHHNGLVGQLLHLILTPPYDEDPPQSLDMLNQDEYTAARRAGEQMYDCQQLYSGCPIGHGLFDLISYMV